MVEFFRCPMETYSSLLRFFHFPFFIYTLEWSTIAACYWGHFSNRWSIILDRVPRMCTSQANFCCIYLSHNLPRQMMKVQVVPWLNSSLPALFPVVSSLLQINADRRSANLLQQIYSTGEWNDSLHFLLASPTSTSGSFESPPLDSADSSSECSRCLRTPTIPSLAHLSPNFLLRFQCLLTGVGNSETIVGSNWDILALFYLILKWLSFFPSNFALFKIPGTSQIFVPNSAS